MNQMEKNNFMNGQIYNSAWETHIKIEGEE